MPDLPCPAKDRKGDQGQRKRDEEFRATIAVRSDVIQGGQIVKWTEIPDGDVQNFKGFARAAPNS